MKVLSEARLTLKITPYCSCRDNLKSQAIALLMRDDERAMFVLKSAIAP
jgi:hypothetical protein